MLVDVFAELIGLFIEDGSLALQIAAVVVLTTITTNLFPSVPLVSGAILLFGCLGMLLANVWLSRIGKDHID
jgi:hypothetical protein